MRHITKWVKAESRKQVKGLDLRTRVKPKQHEKPKKRTTREFLEMAEEDC